MSFFFFSENQQVTFFVRQQDVRVDEPQAVFDSIKNYVSNDEVQVCRGKFQSDCNFKIIYFDEDIQPKMSTDFSTWSASLLMCWKM